MPFPNMPIRVPFSKSTVFKISRQIMCRFRVDWRPVRHIFYHFQNVPASCEHSLNLPDLALKIRRHTVVTLTYVFKMFKCSFSLHFGYFNFVFLMFHSTSTKGKDSLSITITVKVSPIL